MSPNDTRSTNFYTYNPLPPPPARTIRLIRIIPSAEPSAPISVEIETHPLSSAPPYDAISYVWGHPSIIPVPITCNGALLFITPNLHWALRRVRAAANGTHALIWADAICINQADDAGCSAQVAFMGEIYVSTCRVLVCMGDAPVKGDEKEAAMLIDIVKPFREGRLELDDEGSSLGEERSGRELSSWVRNAGRAWSALGDLTRRPWFTRVWVIQEVGLAKNPVVFYGAEEFGYRDLVMTVAWARNHPSFSSHGLQAWRIHIEWLDWSRAARKGNAQLKRNFRDLLDHASVLSCRDPRDRIYAFLGHPLARTVDGQHPLISSDYSKDVNELYVEVTKVLLETGWLANLGFG